MTPKDIDLLTALFIGAMALLYFVAVLYWEVFSLRVMYSPHDWALLLLVGCMTLLGLRVFVSKKVGVLTKKT